MYIFYHIFGAKEIFLRLPNILAFILYSFITYKILIKIKNVFLMLLGIALLLLNPYLLDFFCLARGYGLSLGFGLAALFFLFKQNGFITYKHYVIGLSLSLFFSLLSAGSNLICINLNISLMIIFLIELFFLVKNKTIQLNKKRIGAIVLIFILNIFFLFILVNQLLILKNNNELYFGGANNFIDNTLTILIYRSIYFSYYGAQFWISIRQIIITVYLITIIYQICSKEYSHLSRITLLLLLMIFASILQHYVFNALYPTERTSLIFIPLFGLFIYYLFLEIYSKLVTRKITRIVFNLFILLLLCLPIGWHLKNNLNLKYSKDWKQDAYTKDIMKIIIESHNKDIYKSKKISISNTWFFEPSMNYYRDLYSMDYINSANRNGIDSSTDFIYCIMEEKEKLKAEDHYSIIREYKDAESILMKKVN